MQLRLPGNKNISTLIIILVYIGLNTFLLLKEYYVFMVFPFVLLVIWWLFFNPDNILFLIALLTPLTVSFYQEEIGIAVSLPTEPLMAVLMAFFLIRSFIVQDYDKKVLKHPLTIAILVNLLWILITSISSTMPVISFKFFASRLWFIVIFYFMAINLFKKFANMKKFMWFFTTTLVLVIIYTLYNHSRSFFTQEEANTAAIPFFKDHTIYGAVLAIVFPIAVGFALKNKTLKLNNLGRITAYVFSGLLLIALVFSYTRAAWISVVAALMMFGFVLLKLRFRTLMIITIVALTLIAINWTAFLVNARHNETISSSDFKEHVQSIYNITTDPSNSERINRWNCAVRMFKEKPLLGWGPGTYMFKYAPFQVSYEKTIISTNWGNRGNAHSEYLGPLAESGVLGMLTFLVIAALIIYKGMELYYRGRTHQIRIMALILLLALTTYLTHGFLNNFLDQDKASVPFWAFVAMLTALDVYHNQKEEENEEDQN